jgi:predicted transcriptional regulator
MKAKKAKIILQSVEDIKREWTKALKGKVKSKPKGDEIIVTGLDTIAKIFSKTRMEILQTIITQKPKSLYELAKMINRDFKNVHSDVGLIKLKKTGNSRRGLQPIAKYSGIELDLVAQSPIELKPFEPRVLKGVRLSDPHSI